MSESPNVQGNQQLALIALVGGRIRFRAKVRLTPVGILAIGGLVTGILLSTAVLVWTAATAPRRHPIATRIKPR